MKIDKLITILKGIYQENLKGYTQSPDNLSLGIYDKIIKIEDYSIKEIEEIVEEIKIKLNQ